MLKQKEILLLTFHKIVGKIILFGYFQLHGIYLYNMYILCIYIYPYILKKKILCS